MLKIGIIGAGRIGQVHAESITKYVKEAEVKSIADVYLSDTVREWAKDMGIKEVYEDYKKILEDKEIDAVLICSSTDTHSPIVSLGLSATLVQAIKAPSTINPQHSLGYCCLAWLIICSVKVITYRLPQNHRMAVLLFCQI